MSAESQLQGYFARYEPSIARLGKALRAKLRRRLPGLFEVVYVYANQDALVISYSPTENGYDGVCSLGLYPSEAKLFFTRGALLSKVDQNKLLQGRAGVRHVVMNKAAELDRPEVEALIVAALKLAKLALDAKAKGTVVIRAEAQKERASRVRRAARSASAGERTSRSHRRRV